MSKIGVSLKINVSMIEKARLFAGQKGKYLDATVFIDINDLDQYGNSGMITQDVSKEEKTQGVKGSILGNCKVFWNDAVQAPQQSSGGFQHQQASASQQQGGFKPYVPQQGVQQQSQQQAPKVKPQEPNMDFDSDIPF